MIFSTSVGRKSRHKDYSTALTSAVESPTGNKSTSKDSTSGAAFTTRSGPRSKPNLTSSPTNFSTRSRP